MGVEPEKTERPVVMNGQGGGPKLKSVGAGR